MAQPAEDAGRVIGGRDPCRQPKDLVSGAFRVARAGYGPISDRPIAVEWHMEWPRPGLPTHVVSCLLAQEKALRRGSGSVSCRARLQKEQLPRTAGGRDGDLAEVFLATGSGPRGGRRTRGERPLSEQMGKPSPPRPCARAALSTARHSARLADRGTQCVSRARVTKDGQVESRSARRRSP